MYRAYRCAVVGDPMNDLYHQYFNLISHFSTTQYVLSFDQTDFC